MLKIEYTQKDLFLASIRAQVLYSVDCWCVGMCRGGHAVANNPSGAFVWVSVPPGIKEYSLDFPPGSSLCGSNFGLYLVLLRYL